MAQQLLLPRKKERKKPSSLHRYNKIEMMPAMAKDLNFGSAVGGAGGTANGGNASGSYGKPQQELPSVTHQYAEQYVYAYPAAPPYGGPPKPPPAYGYGYGYGGGGGGGYGYSYGYPEPDGIWDEPAGAYGGGRYRPPQPPYYHGGGRGGYPSPQFGRGAGAGGYSYYGGGGGGGGYPLSSCPTAGGGGGHGVNNAYGVPPQQKPHMSVGWLAAGAATAYGAYQHHMRKHQGEGGHGYRHGHGGDDDGCGGGSDGYGYGYGYSRGCSPHMHMQGEFEHEQHTNIKYSAHHDGKCNDAASGPPVVTALLDKKASQPTGHVQHGQIPS